MKFFAGVCTCLIILLNIMPISPAQGATVEEKIVNISAEFLNKPYGVNPLGEGPQGKYSQKPLYRFDEFDCQTYIETVLALILSDNNAGKFQQQLLQIRYSNGKPDFFTRNHFPSVDWIPHNIQKGYIKLLNLNNQFISGVIYKRQWIKQQTAIDDPHIPVQLKVTLPYISVDKLPKVINKIPQGAIIMIVKPKVTLISHMGFAIWKNHILYLRSASSLYHKVIDVPLLAYLDRQAKYGKVKGIVVLKITGSE